VVKCEAFLGKRLARALPSNRKLGTRFLYAFFFLVFYISSSISLYNLCIFSPMGLGLVDCDLLSLTQRHALT